MRIEVALRADDPNSDSVEVVVVLRGGRCELERPARDLARALAAMAAREGAGVVDVVGLGAE